ncbi:MAG: MATE family efflux transporter [Firmicutes bacterium]|nr:MATE family efflux transporter [Bacillota bacterium]
MNLLGLAEPRLHKEYASVMLTVAVPVVLQNLISIGLNLVDVLMIGRLGVNELAAVGAANRIYSIFGMICFGLISGFSVYIAQYWGLKDIKSIRKVYGLALTSMLSVAMLFILLATFAGRQLLALFLQDQAVVELGLQYLNIAMFSYPFMAYSFCTGFSSRSIRRLRGATIINALALLTNTLLNYSLIFGNFGMPRLGVVGAAIATVIARVFEFIMLAAYVYISREHPFAGRLSEIFTFSKTLTHKVFSTTLPVLVNESSITLGITLFYVTIRYLGTEALAVMQVSMVINDLFLAIFFGVGNAVAVITGNELGRGQIDRSYANGKLALKITLLLSLITGGLLLASRGFIVRIYDFDVYTSALLSQVLLVRALFTPSRMLVYVLIVGLLRAGGDTRFCMIVDAGSVCLIGVPLAFVGTLILHWQLPAVVGLLFSCDLVSLVLCLWRFRSKVWIKTLI